MEKLTILQRNLTFSEALQALKEDKLVKLPEYKGYWFLKGGKVTVKTYDGQETTDPWLKETVLREDWQIVEIDKEWEKEQRDLVADIIKSQTIYTSVGRTEDLEFINEGILVQDNSIAFQYWLDNQKISWRPCGHQTLILGNRDMFEIGCAWTNYKIADKANPFKDIEVPE